LILGLKVTLELFSSPERVSKRQDQQGKTIFDPRMGNDLVQLSAAFMLGLS
jgi:hypothetical protein